MKFIGSGYTLLYSFIAKSWNEMDKFIVRLFCVRGDILPVVNYTAIFFIVKKRIINLPFLFVQVFHELLILRFYFGHMQTSCMCMT